MKIIPNPTATVSSTPKLSSIASSSPPPLPQSPLPAVASSFSDQDYAASESEGDPAPAHITVQFSDEDPSNSCANDAGLFCSPTPLPTPLGIPRLFVSSAHRHKGIAQTLLDAAARSFIHGCPLRPELGQVAFSQPTRAGRGVMEKWGKGGIRIYEE